jgi:MoaA/NifB/PqqE/SkfB family radical SAM enzyme
LRKKQTEVDTLDTAIASEMPVRSQPLTVWDWARFGPFLAQIVVIRRCNLSCAYCSEFDTVSEPIPFETLSRRFRKLRDLKSWAVCLTGGEPTLHPRLPDLIGELRRLGIRRRLMITNGYKLTRELIEAFNENGLTDLQISIDGVEPTATTVKTLKPLRKKLALLKDHARFKVVVSGVIGSAPPQEALEVIDFVRKNGFIPRILLRNCRHTGRSNAKSAGGLKTQTLTGSS